MKRLLLALVLSIIVSPVFAQWQVPSGSIPVGRGPGVVGFNSVLGSLGTGTKCLLDTSPPAFGSCAALAVGTSPITGGTSFGVIYNNAGFLGNTVAGTNGQLFLGSTGVAPLWATLSQDCTITNAGVITCTKTNNVAFAASATTDTTNGSNISTGTVAVARGGTGIGSGTSGGVLCFTAAGVIASSVAATANAIMLGGGAGVCPSPLGSLGTTTTVLHGNAAGGPSYASVAYADIASAAIASGAQYIAGTSSELVQSGVIYQAETTTTFGATTTFDFSTFINTNVTLTANITTQTLSNVTAGKAGTISFTQSGAGSFTTVWNSIFKFAGGTTPALTIGSTTAVDVLSYSCRSATFCVASLLKDVR